MKDEPLGHSRSLCPVCLKALPAEIIRRGQDVLLERVCPEHGAYSGLIWRGEPDFTRWKRPKPADPPPFKERETNQGCPHDCGRCPEHGQHACTVLFEITRRCNLHCPVCFASAGEEGLDDPGFAPLAHLTGQLHWIREHAGPVVLQLSGGEPSLYPELPHLVREARTLFPAVQLNSNGLLLAEQPQLAKDLAAAGLSWVFLQFDGTRDDIYLALRGKALLQSKLRAIENCRAAGLPVVLTPTLARGVNDDNLGDLLDLALSFAPAVRGLHLQPMTGSGRNALAGKSDPLTLPETLQALCAQSSGRIRPEHATPPGCEHERCSFHCRYRLGPAGELLPLRGQDEAPCCCAVPDRATPQNSAGDAEGVKRAIDVILRSWQGPAGQSDPTGQKAAPDAFDAFIAAASRSFSVTCMAFQDVMTVDLERLRGCCVHVFCPPARLVPFCAFNMTALDGRALHRQHKKSAFP
ncbi:radical SAM protein [Desulfovibrio sp. OttesenSCG-928-M16]|nr:radical SAM protein [Desulfovibrio sp. OttesenSCG-928-M16]